MNYVENLKLAQWRTLFKLFKYSRMQSFNIFGARGDLLFEFASLSRVWKLENYLIRPGPHVSGPFLFDRPGLLPGLARHPYFWWLCSPRGERSVPVATCRHRPHGLPPPLSLLRTSLRKPPPSSLFPSHRSVVLLVALLYIGHRFTAVDHHR
jgi:hypothetical protein